MNEETSEKINAESSTGYVPPKNWKDLSVDEKLERIREQIKFLQRDIPNVRGQVNKVENDLKNHEHLNGKVMKDIKTRDSFGIVGSRLNDTEKEAKGEVYF